MKYDIPRVVIDTKYACLRVCDSFLGIKFSLFAEI